MSSEFLASLWKNFRGHGILRVQIPNYTVLFHGLKFCPENHKNFTPRKIPTIWYLFMLREKSAITREERIAIEVYRD